MAGFARARPVAVETAAPVSDDAPLVATDRVGDVLDRYPHLLDVFVAHGFAPLANPVVRRVAAGRTTIAAACRRMGVDAGALLAELNDARAGAGHHAGAACGHS
jgi:hypothetical protein